jgi:hypothetical protein
MSVQQNANIAVGFFAIQIPDFRGIAQKLSFCINAGNNICGSVRLALDDIVINIPQPSLGLRSPVIAAM